MTANKMPKPRTALEEQCVAYGTACFDAGYLAGLEAAKACVPAQSYFGNKIWNDDWLNGMEDCRAATLANLKALEEGVAKGPALERTASGANFPKKEEAKK